MANYKVDINSIVELEDAQQMINKAESIRDKFLIAILYITGARPIELTMLTSEHIQEEESNLIIKLFTAKLGRSKGFTPDERELEIKPSTPFFKILNEYYQLYKKWPEQPMLSISVRRMEQIIGELSDHKFCPYNFRHSRMTKLSRAGASIDQLMYWKGAKDTRSVSPYLRSKRVVFDRIE